MSFLYSSSSKRRGCRSQKELWGCFHFPPIQVDAFVPHSPEYPEHLYGIHVQDVGVAGGTGSDPGIVARNTKHIVHPHHIGPHDVGLQAAPRFVPGGHLQLSVKFRAVTSPSIISMSRFNLPVAVLRGGETSAVRTNLPDFKSLSRREMGSWYAGG